jgi:hypothetical protein
MKMSRAVRTVLVLIAALLLLLPFIAAAEPVTKEFRKELAAQPGVVVVLENLAGKVTVEGAKGGPVEIVATVHAESVDHLAELPIDVVESAGRIEVTAKFPVEKHDVFRYEDEHHRSIGWGSTSTTYLGRRVKVVSGPGRGVTLWVDFHLRLPAGTGATFRNEVGRISASNVNGPLSARTGSGGITLKRVEGERVTARTGSGEITLHAAKGVLDLGTGSGNIRGDDLTVAGALDLHTGSGDVKLSGDFAGLKEAKVGTSSGDVVLRMAKAPGMNLSCRTTSGDIDVDVPGTRLKTERKLEVAVGGGGVPVTVRTSSGSIRIEGR